MTLILTWFSESRIVQVSDTRISYLQDGTPVRTPNDTARKCIGLTTPDAFCVIAYTGFATLSMHPGERPLPLEEWIAAQVARLPTGSTLPDVVRRLTQELDGALPGTLQWYPGVSRSPTLTVTISGFSSVEDAALFICISNRLEFGHTLGAVPKGSAPLLELTRAGKLTHAYGAFTYTVGLKRNKSLSILAHGDLRGLTRSIVNPMWRIAKQIDTRGVSDRAIRRLLVASLRRARSHGSANTIGVDCWSVGLTPKDGTATVDVHLEGNPIIRAVLPRMVGPQFHVGPAFVGKNDVPAEILVRYRSRFESGDFSLPVTQEALGAYIELSSRVAEWLSYIRHLGYNIGPVGAVDRAVAFVERADLTRLDQVDEVLQTSRGWGHSLIQEFLARTYSNAEVAVIDRIAPIIYLIIGNRPDVFTDAVLRGEFSWGSPERITEPARRFSPRGASA